MKRNVQKVKLRALFVKYKELISYVFWGAATTAVNYAIYFPCTCLLRLDHIVSNVIAWVVAVLFAFIVNKAFVFASSSWNRSTVLSELWKFVSARLFSGGLETLLLFIFVNLLHVSDGIVKILAGVVVILLNYAVSKVFIFKKNTKNS